MVLGFTKLKLLIEIFRSFINWEGVKKITGGNYIGTANNILSLVDYLYGLELTRNKVKKKKTR